MRKYSSSWRTVALFCIATAFLLLVRFGNDRIKISPFDRISSADRTMGINASLGPPTNASNPDDLIRSWLGGDRPDHIPSPTIEERANESPIQDEEGEGDQIDELRKIKIPQGITGAFGNDALQLGFLSKKVRSLGGRIVRGKIPFWKRNTSTLPLCTVKYPPLALQALKHRIDMLGIKRIAIVSIMRDGEKILPFWANAVMKAIMVLGSPEIVVSIVESNSKRTSSSTLLQFFQDDLNANGVRSVVSTRDEIIPNTLRSDRIEYLAKLRNVAMRPIYELTITKQFDRIIFLNDVVLCGGDILRLLAHDADMACGADFEQDGFYDHWVMEWEPETFVAWDRRRFPEAPSANLDPSHDRTVPVFACWNGAVAFRGDVIRYGVRFRRSMLELGDAVDCAQSECSLFALDLHRLGFHRIVLDASVHVAYSVEQFDRWARDTHPQVKYHVVTPQKNGTSRTDWRCCPLDRGELLVQSSKCRMVPLYLPPCDRDVNATACLMYHPQRWEVEWDWRSSALFPFSNTMRFSPMLFLCSCSVLVWLFRSQLLTVALVVCRRLQRLSW